MFFLVIIMFYRRIQSNFNGSNTDGSFTMAYSNSFLSPYGFFPIAQEKKILREIFLFYYEIVCCVYSLESPHRLIEAILMSTHNIPLFCWKPKTFP